MYPSFHNVIKFNQTIIPFVLVGYNQLVATRASLTDTGDNSRTPDSTDIIWAFSCPTNYVKRISNIS